MIGWTDLEGTPHDEIIYVSSSGNDGNSGLSEDQPLATLAAAYELAESGEPDWILLKRGETFPVPTGMAWARSGPLEADAGWARLGAYGTGPRPIVDCVAASLCIGLGPGFQSPTPLTHVAFTDIHFTESQRLAEGGSTAVFATAIDLAVAMYAGGGTAFRDILIEGCKLSGFQHGITSASDTERLTIRRNIFTEFFRSINMEHGTAVLNSGEDMLLEENVFYRLHDPIMEQVAEWFAFSHSAYLGAEGSSRARGNIVIRAPEGLMQRNAVEYDQNFVALNHFTAVNTGVAFGVVPHAGGLAPDVTDSLSLDNEADWVFGNMSGPATVARNLMFRTADNFEDDFVLWGNADGTGPTNVGVHNTSFEDNWLSGTIEHQFGAPNTEPHYSGNTLTRNTENVGSIATQIGDYLSAAGIPGTTFDDYGEFLISWEEHDDYTVAYTACALINFYRAAETTLEPIVCQGVDE